MSQKVEKHVLLNEHMLISINSYYLFITFKFNSIAL